MKKLLLLISISILAFGCRSKLLEGEILEAYKLDLNDNTAISPHPLKMEMGLELWDLRLDLYRKEYTRKKPGDDTPLDLRPTDRMTNMAIGLHLGNGLFVDCNEVVGVDILDFYDVDAEKTDIVIQFPTAEEKIQRRIVKEDDFIVGYYSNEEEAERTYKFYKDSVRSYYSDRGSFVTYVMTDQSYRLNTSMGYALVKKGEHKYEKEAGMFFKNRDFERLAPDTLQFEETMVIRTDKEIQILEDDPRELDDGSYVVDKHLIIKKDGFVCYDYKGECFRSNRVADTIFVHRNHELTMKMQLVKR